MPITVADAYQLKSLQGARILTGQSGFNNIIERMGILDYEFITNKMQGEFIKNDFVLCSFLFAKDDVKLLLAAIKNLIENGVSCLGIKDVYYKTLPQEIIDYAQEKSFSMFFFGDEAYFENIITEVNDTLRLVDNNRLIEMRLDMLIGKNVSKSVVRELATEINKSFQKNFIAFYFRKIHFEDDGALFRTLDRLRASDLFLRHNSIFKYNSGLLAILTFDDLKNVDPKNITRDFLAKTALSTDTFYVGVSEPFFNLNELDKGIQQALYSCKVASLVGRNLCPYDTIGIYQILLPYLEDYWMQHFYERIIRPLKTYDEKYSTEIFNTIVCYIQNDCNMKRTAELLCQHENTIRYRMHKAKELLGMVGRDSSFQEQLSIAVKLYLLQSSYL